MDEGDQKVPKLEVASISRGIERQVLEFHDLCYLAVNTVAGGPRSKLK